MSAPTLLVGIGGTGSGIVQRVYELATKKQRENIGFVIFDTDVNELRTIEEKTPQIKTVQTSNRMTVGEYLDADEYSRNTWFPVNRILNSKALTEGAGQVRAISRLALNTTIKQGRMTPLDEAVEELYELNGQKTVQAPRVIITGSLCGGTGSGLVLPISLYIRNFMSTKLQQGSAIIRGFFLLPEVFDGVIKTQSERNNLRSNAYAAIRELDAFMMKDDGSLPPQYDLHFYAPRAGSKQPEEYTGRPMDFCFLFDAQNINGQKLKSFADYKEHAAHCIYGMAIAPTSKRSNSSEDNVIREIIFAGGRNRYAGAGSAILRYPKEDIKKYLALCWTKESISSEWLSVDQKYMQVVEDSVKARMGGSSQPQIDRGQHYIQTIDAELLEKHSSFANSIRDAVTQHDKGHFSETGSNWDKYLEQIYSYVLKRIEKQKEYLEQVTEDLNSCYSDVLNKGDATSFENWYSSILTYRSVTIKNTEVLIRNIVYSLFDDETDYTNTTDEFRLEYWLRIESKEDTFAHPNAIRYFLYNLYNKACSLEIERRGVVDEIETNWRDFEKNTFKLSQDGNVQEGDKKIEVSNQLGYYDEHHLNTESTIEKLLHRADISSAQESLRTSFFKYQSGIDSYWENRVMEEIYKECAAYVSSIIDAFHKFYDTLKKTINGLDYRIDKLEEKYAYKPGEALRYVCADQVCLKALSQEVINMNSSLNMPAELNKKIFRSLKAYAMSDQKPDEEKYFLNTFNESIVGYFEDEVMSQYPSVIDMDIITAMEKEALYRKPDECYELADQRLYAKNIIDSMGMLAKPFIESPTGKEPRIIPSCAYSPDLTNPEKADFPNRKEFVSKYLKDMGGEEDESIDKNMILFYQAVYDIRANELSKFAPARQEETFSSPDGDYYKAYYELINQINPNTVKSKVITPHIDKWWHVIDKLPDLDEKSQEEQEKRIYAAFFWGVIAQYVRLLPESEGKNVYYLDQNKIGLSGNEQIEQKLAYEAVQFEDALIVSNGTSCDHIYEIMDAFTIYPALVTAVLAQAKKRTEMNLYDKKKLTDSYLFECIRNFEIGEYSLGSSDNPDRKRLVEVLQQVKEENLIRSTGMDKRVGEILDGLEEGSGDKRSIFELPIIMKASVPAEMYYEKNVKTMIIGMFELIRQYIHRFCSEKEFVIEYANLLKDQYRLFLKNISREKEEFPIRDMYHDTLFIYMCGAIQREFETLDFNKEAGLIENITNKLSRV